MQNILYKINFNPAFKEHCLSICVLFLLCNLGMTDVMFCWPTYAASREINKMSEHFTLSSSGFKSGQRIPKRYTADGSDVSPGLSWTAIPAGTKSFALICADPDAPTGVWVQWLVYDIPSFRNSLPQAVPADATLKDQTKQGVNSFRHVGYDGPSPPLGSLHRYFFRLYALDELFGYESPITLYKFTEFVQRHKIAEAEIIGTYSR